MAGAASIAATGLSIERYLNLCFDEDEPVEGRNTAARLVRTEDLPPAAGTIVPPALSIFLYRVNFNNVMRAAWSGVSHQDGQVHLPLDLHFLLTPWADNAEFEQRILGRTLQCLESNPILSGPLLARAGGFSAGEAIQLCLADLTTEDVMRTYDSLPIDYKLSVCYLARAVRVDEASARPAPVVTQVEVGRRPSVEGA